MGPCSPRNAGGFTSRLYRNGHRWQGLVKQQAVDQRLTMKGVDGVDIRIDILDLLFMEQIQDLFGSESG